MQYANLTYLDFFKKYSSQRIISIIKSLILYFLLFYAILSIFLICQMCIIKNMRSERNITEISRSMTTGQRLRYLRKIKGFTQIKVQMLTSIDQSDYSRLETDSRYPTVGQAISLAFIFDTSLDYIYGLTDDPAPYPRP